MSDRAPLHLFAGYGIELEYMIVDRETLDVRPVADELIRAVMGAYVSDVERGDIGWSNELVLHVIELKTNGPAPRLDDLAAKFQQNVREINALLAPLGACLMPTAAHPWMDPHGETRLWPHEYNAVYESYNRIFDCRGHGWSNLQSMHINLPFAGDEEFGRLHAAVRMVLPILPALAASSPVIELKRTGSLDTRLEYYKTNSRKIPSITGHVVPEAVYTEADYVREIFERTYRDIEPHDPEGILQDEFLNSRGAIARFGRGTIEIRVLDIQECPKADLAIAQAIVAVLKALVSEQLLSFDEQKRFVTEELKALFDETVKHAGNAALDGRHAPYVEALAGTSRGIGTVRELWLATLSRVLPTALGTGEPLSIILGAEGGTLSERILRGLGPGEAWDRTRARGVYRTLCDCLERGEQFPAKG